ncbi:MAG: Prephenate dehydratase [Solirubrobacterales bacterium]|nr:Prephenate dehydratase [Solirubrobacterales bacterium]
MTPGAPRLRIGYLGPDGTFSHEAVLDAIADPDEVELVALPTVYDTVMAVHDGRVDRGLVPIENSLEGSVNATLDALAVETEDVAIVGESVHAVRHCLIAREPMELEEVEEVISHPQANAQCARFIRDRLPGASVLSASSTAEAVRMVAAQGGRRAALSTRLAAELYGCEVLRAGVEDVAENETRFVWIARRDAETPGERHGPWKTSLVFWGVGAEAPGWLVRCLSEFAFRGVNLTRIESRPRKQGLGRYMFFIDLEGRDTDRPVAEAVAALEGQTERVRVVGSYPAA